MANSAYQQGYDDGYKGKGGANKNGCHYLASQAYYAGLHHGKKAR